MTLAEYLFKIYPNGADTLQQTLDAIKRYYELYPAAFSPPTNLTAPLGTAQSDPFVGTQYRPLPVSEQPKYEYLKESETTYEDSRLVTRYKGFLVYIDYTKKAIDLNKGTSSNVYNPYYQPQRKAPEASNNNTILYILAGLLALFLISKR